MFFLAIIAFILVIGTLVLIHELGHFIFAKRSGILCSEFAIGMGPVLYKTKKGETNFVIRALPIGGFVAMAGDSMDDALIKKGMLISLNLENNLVTEIITNQKLDGMIQGKVIDFDLYGKDEQEVFIEIEVNSVKQRYFLAKEAFYVTSSTRKLPIAPYDRCFESKSVKNRILTLAAGPIFNLLLALVIFIIIGLANGVPNNTNEIGSVTSDYAVEFLEEGDIIQSIGSTTITNWDDIGPAIDRYEENFADFIEIKVLRDGNPDPLPVRIRASIQLNSIGINNVGISEEMHEDANALSGFIIGDVPSGNNSAGILKQYDVITGIGFENNGYNIIPTPTWASFKEELDKNEGQKIKIEYYRDNNKKVSETITPFTTKTLNDLKIEDYSYVVGISPTTKFDLFEGVKNGFLLTWDNATVIFRTLGMIINPSAQLGVSDLSGPVGIFSLIEGYLNAGFIAFLGLIGLLSINLFVVNLLPFPGLDGGRLIFVVYEGITKKKVNKKVENTVNLVGFVLLMVLMFYVTFNDVLKLFG